MIALPPLLAGGAKVTAALALPATAETDDTRVGFVAGVIALEADDGPAVPDEFVAVEVKVYDVPLLSPEIAQLDAGA